MGILDWITDKLNEWVDEDEYEDDEYEDDEYEDDEYEDDEDEDDEDAEKIAEFQEKIKYCFEEKMINDSGNYVAWEYNKINEEKFDMEGYDPRFDSTVRFKDGYSAVLKDNRWGIIDSDGKIIVHPVYDGIIIDYLESSIRKTILGENNAINLFSDGLVNVKLNRKWGFINTEGKMVIEPKYDEVKCYHVDSVWNPTGYGFYNDMAVVVLNDVSYLINKEEEKIAISESFGVTLSFRTTDENFIYYTFDGQGGRINKKTKEITDPDFADIVAFDDTNFVQEDENGYFGIIDGDGNYIVEPEFLSVEKFADGLFIVEVEEDKYKIINSNGEYIVDTEFDEVCPYVNGCAAVCLNGKCGYIDIDGRFIIEPQFERSHTFGDNGYAAVRIDGKYGYMDGSCNIKIKPQFDRAKRFSNGLAAVCKNGKFGFIDETGKLIIDYQFKEAYYFDDDGYAAVRIENISDEEIKLITGNTDYYFEDYSVNMWIDKKGRLLFNKPKDGKYREYMSFIPYKSSICTTSQYGNKDYLWGYYKIENGNRICVIPPSFLAAYGFDEDGCAEVFAQNWRDKEHIKIV